MRALVVDDTVLSEMGSEFYGGRWAEEEATALRDMAACEIAFRGLALREVGHALDLEEGYNGVIKEYIELGYEDNEDNGYGKSTLVVCFAAKISQTNLFSRG